MVYISLLASKLWLIGLKEVSPYCTPLIVQDRHDFFS